MQRTLTLTDTSIGKKAIVAVTGLVLFGFVIAHMIGNLQIFLGPEVYNHYAETMQSLGPILWVMRLIVLGSVALHAYFTILLVRQAQAARPHAYRVQTSAVTTYAARTMKLTGPMLAAFILYHLVHFTFPGVPMGDYVHDHHDVYAAFVASFQIPWVTGIYVIAQVLLGFHIYHGAWSLFQTLGLSHPRYNMWRQVIPQSLALLVIVGNISMPVAVLLGVIE